MKLPLLDWFFRQDERIVNWALEDEDIPLRCSICGALYITKNKCYIGFSPIIFGEDTDLCIYCDIAEHSGEYLKPNRKYYDIYMSGRYRKRGEKFHKNK